MQYNEFIPQLFIGFIVLRIDDDGVINRANALTGRFIIMTHALSAAVTVNLVNLSAHRDCLTRALRLAHVAIDAFVCDKQGHNLSRFSNNPGAQYSRFDLNRAFACRLSLSEMIRIKPTSSLTLRCV